MKPQTVDKLVAVILIVIAVICLGCAIHYHRAVEKVTDKICENPAPEVPAVIHYDNAADYYFDLLSKMQAGLLDTELPFYIKDLTKYTVDANPTLQHKVDESLWGYCLRTSDLFRSTCNYMTEKREYGDKMFNVLICIVFTQDISINDYGSDMLKKKVAQDVFLQEKEMLTEVVNQTLDKKCPNRLMEVLESKTK